MTERKVCWRMAPLRPMAMPSVECPCVLDWETHKAWLGVWHCLSCAAMRGVRLDARAQTGTVLCAVEEAGP